MRRRDFLAMLGGSAALLPATAVAQSPARPLVAILHPSSEPFARDQIAAFTARLGELGYSAGRNIELALRFDAGRSDDALRLGTELLALNPVVLVTAANPTVLAVHQLTASVPVVITGFYADPVAAGLAKSLAHPGGNFTGIMLTSNLAIFGKQLALLKELAPAIARVAVLLFGGDETTLRVLPEAARNLNLTIRPFPVARADDLAAAIAAAAGETDALCFAPSPLLSNETPALVAPTHRPAVYPFGSIASAGGLMSYGASLPRNWVVGAEYVAKILGGAKPGDLPIQQPDLYDLVINLKTAKAMGLVVPTSLLIRADAVIE
jgi:putative tryptophan/tyrosine transport system substrate-binding protein